MHRAAPFVQCSIDETPILASQDSDLTLQRSSFPGIPLAFGPTTIQYLSRHLASFPPMFAERRGTPFIGLQVYDDSLLKSIQDMPSICAYTIASPTANNGYLKRYLNKTISSTPPKLLIRSRTSWPPYKPLSSSWLCASSRATLKAHPP